MAAGAPRSLGDQYGWKLAAGRRAELAGRFAAVLADNPVRPRPVRWWPTRNPIHPRGRVSLAPAQLVQPVVIDAEVVRDLVHDSDTHFVDDIGVRVADAQDG